MRVSRVYVDMPLVEDREIPLPDPVAHYATTVLRLRKGDRVRLFDGSGRDFDARVTLSSRRLFTVRIAGSRAVSTETPLEITLAIGVSRGDRMDFAIQKSVELGVMRVVPLLSARAMVRLTSERAQSRHRHWHRIVVSACEQSGRSVLPELEEAVMVSEWLGRPPRGSGLVLAPGAPRTLGDVSRPNDEAATIMVGPEGGLDENEVALARHIGYRAISLGPRILRTETAAAAALTAVQTLWGDLATAPPGASGD